MIRSPLPLAACLDEVFAGRDVYVEVDIDPFGETRVVTSFAAIVEQLCDPLVEKMKALLWYDALTSD